MVAPLTWPSDRFGVALRELKSVYIDDACVGSNPKRICELLVARYKCSYEIHVPLIKEIKI